MSGQCPLAAALHHSGHQGVSNVSCAETVRVMNSYQHILVQSFVFTSLAVINCTWINIYVVILSWLISLTSTPAGRLVSASSRVFIPALITVTTSSLQKVATHRHFHTQAGVKPKKHGIESKISAKDNKQLLPLLRHFMAVGKTSLGAYQNILFLLLILLFFFLSLRQTAAWCITATFWYKSVKQNDFPKSFLLITFLFTCIMLNW